MNNATKSAPGSGDASGRPDQDNKSLPADQRMRQAVARIEASRSALITRLAPNPPASRATESSFAETLAAQIERNGLLQGGWRTVRTLARRWWTRQPWHSSIDLVGQTLAHRARPLMRRHPLATLAVGAALGAGLVATVSALRPWAWRRIQQPASPWRDRLGSLLWAQLTAAPVQMALAGALAAWLADQGSRNAGSKNRSAEPTTRPAEANGTSSVKT